MHEYENAYTHEHENHEKWFLMKDIRGFQFEKGKTLKASGFLKPREDLRDFRAWKPPKEDFDLKIRNPGLWVACEIVSLGNSDPSLANRGIRKA